jgi:hypothetical protein
MQNPSNATLARNFIDFIFLSYSLAVVLVRHCMARLIESRAHFSGRLEKAERTSKFLVRRKDGHLSCRDLS